jgi:hypothetical protein
MAGTACSVRLSRSSLHLLVPQLYESRVTNYLRRPDGLLLIADNFLDSRCRHTCVIPLRSWQLRRVPQYEEKRRRQQADHQPRSR